MDERLIDTLTEFRDGSGRLTVLSGAGISAESGIPTFRGPEGYWTVGSREYHPQEMATYAMFARDSDAVWQWYLYRMGVCSQAKPNSGHVAVVELEKCYNDRFLLVTQNVDGLHLKAGNSPDRTYQIHGNIFTFRCSHECSATLYPIPEDLASRAKGAPLTAEEKQRLTCPKCGAMARPHVLWFDECYDEKHYRFESSLRAAADTALLLVVGTSGATNLPIQMGTVVARSGGAIVDVNPETNPFSRMALSTKRGFHVAGRSADMLPQIARVLMG